MPFITYIYENSNRREYLTHNSTATAPSSIKRISVYFLQVTRSQWPFPMERRRRISKCMFKHNKLIALKLDNSGRARATEGRTLSSSRISLGGCRMHSSPIMDQGCISLWGDLKRNWWRRASSPARLTKPRKSPDKGWTYKQSILRTRARVTIYDSPRNPNRIIEMIQPFVFS